MLSYSSPQVPQLLFKSLPGLGASWGIYGIFVYLLSFIAELQWFPNYLKYFLSLPRLGNKPKFFWLYLYFSSNFTTELQFFTKYLSSHFKVCLGWDQTQDLLDIFVFFL
jgi:hypothetical protein